MNENTEYLEIIRQAQLGSRDHMSRLAEQARGRLFVYVYRLTLDYHLAEELSQETLLEMVKSLKRLRIEDARSFWAWLYRTALGKVQHHFKYQGNRRIEQKTTCSDWELLKNIPEDKKSGLETLLHKELSQAVLKAMSRMKVAYRNVLTLRCFDEMSYAEIAEVTGVSEMQARLQFFRAKQSLKRQLAESGYKKEHLLSALGLFGAITGFSARPASAAVLVGSATMQVGVPAVVIGSLTSKTGIIAVAVALVAASAGIGTVKFRNETPVYPGSGRMLRDVKETGVFENPSYLFWVNDPDRTGWRAANYLRPTEPAVLVQPENLLVGRRQTGFAGLALILPQGHGLTLGFSTEIVNGPGIDVCYEGRVTGKLPLLSVGDGAGREVEITSAPSFEDLENGYRLMGYDTAGIPFTPRRLTVVGADNEGRWGGAELSAVWARVSH